MSTRIPGQPLMELNKGAVAGVLSAVALLFLGGGIVAPLYGQYWAIVLALVSPLLLWMGWSILGERLAITTEGVYHVTRGKPIEDFATWEDIARVELVEAHHSSSNRSSVSYTLTFERHHGAPLRYLVGVPPAKRLAHLRQLCEERGIPARV